jgi:hypothetical protein
MIAQEERHSPRKVKRNVVRVCLNCGKDFRSAGPGNRICAKCLASDARRSPAACRLSR